jgi:hypothetical protein
MPLALVEGRLANLQTARRHHRAWGSGAIKAT